MTIDRTKVNILDIAVPYKFNKILKEPDKNIKIIGIDTETYKGKCKLICNSLGKYKVTESFNDCIEFLTDYSHDSKTNVFWNINYDFFAIIKFLPKEQIEIIYSLQKIDLDDYKISWIPNKYFSIIKNHHKYEFFDLMQFYNSSLDSAGETYLKERKIKFDASRLNDLKVWKNEFENIKKYCIQDCKLTANLGLLLNKKFNEIGIDFSKPYSIASISSQWVKRNCIIPPYKREQYQEYAFKSYYGGRFEIFKKGFFDKVYEIDINSAYPSQIVNLLDISKGYWKYKKEIDFDFDIGFLKCKIDINSDYICPLAFKNKGQNLFPNFNSKEIYITLDEYNFINKLDGCNIKFIDGWFFKAKEKIYPFEKFKELYKLKDKIKNIDKVLYNIYKIIMNAFYGKTIELRAKWEKCEKGFAGEILEVMEGNEKGLYEKKYKIGQFFNPVYASLITSRTRLQLLEELYKNKKSCIASFTDSIFLTSSPDENIINNKLGGWDLKGIGELLMIQCGVYTFKTEKETKTRFRGFFLDENNDDKKKKDHTNFIEWFSNNLYETKLSKTLLKPQSLGESLLHENTCEFLDFNNFVSSEKVLNINADKKRKWDRDAKNCGDLLCNQIDSIPLEI